MTTCDLKIGVADHAKLSFDDGGGIGANEEEEIAANVHLGLHSACGIDTDVGDGSHECAEEINFGAAADSRCAGFRQDNAESHVANEPTLAAAGENDDGDENAKGNEDKGAGNRMDMAELEVFGRGIGGGVHG